MSRQLSSNDNLFLRVGEVSVTGPTGARGSPGVREAVCSDPSEGRDKLSSNGDLFVERSMLLRPATANAWLIFAPTGRAPRSAKCRDSCLQTATFLSGALTRLYSHRLKRLPPPGPLGSSRQQPDGRARQAARKPGQLSPDGPAKGVVPDIAALFST